MEVGFSRIYAAAAKDSQSHFRNQKVVVGKTGREVPPARIDVSPSGDTSTIRLWHVALAIPALHNANRGVTLSLRYELTSSVTP
jgi:hypothetical protein